MLTLIRGMTSSFYDLGLEKEGACQCHATRLATVPLGLANLIHCFKWELPSGLVSKDLDMTEIWGYGSQKPNTCLSSQLLSYRLHNNLHRGMKLNSLFIIVVFWVKFNRQAWQMANSQSLYFLFTK
ncbi:hypothetical protein ACFX2I_015745 [Malus domestica]